MKGASKTRARARVIGLVGLGLVIGTTMMATPAVAHVGGTLSHLWGELKLLADPRYANAVPGTDKAKNADKLDGRDSSAFWRSDNDGAGSGLDADTLDGADSGSFAPTGHNHDTAYLGKTDKAADSNQLDGLDSTGFVQGKGTVYRNRVSVTTGSGLILDVPGIAAVRVLNCRTSIPDANVQIDNWNNSQPVDIWRDTGTGTPAFTSPGSGWAWSTPLVAAGKAVFQISSGTGSTARAATVEIWTHANTSRCVFVVTATVYG